MNILKIPLLVDTQAFPCKPTETEVGKIKRRLKQKHLTIDEIINMLMEGYSIIPVLGGIRLDDWQGQQLIMLDFDDGDPEQQLEFLKDNGFNPACIYTTFSDVNHTRFRVMIVLDKMVTNKALMSTLASYLVKTTGADPRCHDLVHLYFGGKEILYKDSDATINLDRVKDALGYKPKQPASTPRTTWSQATITESIRHLKDLDSQWFINRLPPQQEKIANEPMHFVQLQKSISLCQLLGVDSNEMFRCVLPDHEDTTPSAKIYVAEDDLEFYKCFGCDSSILPNHFIELIAECESGQARSFISEVFNIILVESEARKAMNRALDSNIERILSGEIKEMAPTVYQYTKNDTLVLMVLHQMAKYYTSEENITKDSQALFYGSVSKIADGVKGLASEGSWDLSNAGSSRAVISKKQNNLNQMGLINKVSFDKLPAQLRKCISDHKKDTGYSRHTNCYAIPEYSAKYLRSIEQQAKHLKANGYTKTGCSEEYIIRTFGRNAAKELYPQDNGYATKKSDNLTALIEAAVKEAIADKGYCLDKDIYQSLRSSYSAEIIDRQLKISRTELLSQNGWQRTRDKDTRKKFNLPKTRGCPPYIITTT